MSVTNSVGEMDDLGLEAVGTINDLLDGAVSKEDGLFIVTMHDGKILIHQVLEARVVNRDVASVKLLSARYVNPQKVSRERTLWRAKRN